MQDLYEADHLMVVWWSTDTECSSAVARLERDGDITSRGAAHAFERLDALAGRWSEVQPLPSVRRAARRLLRTHPLRAVDALQVAAAIAAAEADPSSLPLVSLDDRLAAAARREGFTVIPS